MSSLWDVPQYLIMAFSLALDAPVEKASRVSHTSLPAPITAVASGASVMPDESFWLRSVKLAAPQSDILSAYAGRIFATTSGRYYVPAESDRADIMALRLNREVTARVLAAATVALGQDLRKRTGLTPTRGALLIAHMAGPKFALAYMQALDTNPEAKAAAAVPSLAQLISDTPGITLAQLDSRLAVSVRPQAGQLAAADPETLKGTLTKPDTDASAPARLAER